jgi:toxin ParE1/3/4
VTETQWRIRLGSEAERDYVSILDYTADTFGQRQAELYKTLLQETLAMLAAGPAAIGSIARDEIRPGLRSLHIARGDRRGRHFVLYRPVAGNVIMVLRILHDSMDLARHIPPHS